ncbi:MAG: hypothetical protein J6A08_10575 [Lachnospiraceae bacterium]|nr:hypothetical protein [Lachnospiraceae bacterium]
MAIEEINTREESAGNVPDGDVDNPVEQETPAQREAREKKEAQEREAKARKRRLIPPFVMLFAGAVTSITMRILHYEMKTMLIVLLCVLVGFYIAGCIFKTMLDRFEQQIEEAAMENGEVIEKDSSTEEAARKSEVNEKGE